MSAKLIFDQVNANIAKAQNERSEAANNVSNFQR